MRENQKTRQETHQEMRWETRTWHRSILLPLLRLTPRLRSWHPDNSDI